MKKLLAVAVASAVVGFACFMAGAMWSGGLTVQAEGDGRGGAVSINGDVNADGRLDVSDGIYIINYVFRGGPLPVPIECPLTGLPATGQTKCYDLGDYLAGIPRKEIPCDSAEFPGQDGAYQAVCSMGGRFLDNGDGTVTDNCTGLMWQKDTADVNGDGEISEASDGGDCPQWQGALIYCDRLDFAEQTDWRLPNIRELQSLVDYGRPYPTIDPVFGALVSQYWSSTTFLDHPQNAWKVQFDSGTVLPDADNPGYVRAVRNMP